MPHDHAFADLIQEYIAECLPLAESVNDACLALERRWDAGDLDAAAVAGLKGALHTLKGNSAMMGLRSMQLVAHALEDLAARVASDDTARGEAESTLLVEGSGLLVDLIRAAAEPDVGAATAAAFVEQVRLDLAASPAGTPATPLRLERRRTDRRTESGPDAGTVRVDFRRLDTLLEIFGEAMIEQSALADIHRRLASRIRSGPELADLDRVVVALGATMKRLETSLMQTRMLPISAAFSAGAAAGASGSTRPFWTGWESPWSTCCQTRSSMGSSPRASGWPVGSRRRPRWGSAPPPWPTGY